VPYYKNHLEAIRTGALHYFDETNPADIDYPFFDIYNLAEAIEQAILDDDDNFVPATNNVLSRSIVLKLAVDELVISSFANSYSGFAEDRSGVHIFFPKGDAEYGGVRLWARYWWYNALRFTNDIYGHPAVSDTGKFAGGKLAWCTDGAAQNNGHVENWFELLAGMMMQPPAGATTAINIDLAKNVGLATGCRSAKRAHDVQKTRAANCVRPKGEIL
jgi:clostripain